jgi:hypothetical protein
LPVFDLHFIGITRVWGSFTQDWGCEIYACCVLCLASLFFLLLDSINSKADLLIPAVLQGFSGLAGWTCTEELRDRGKTNLHCTTFYRVV